MNKVFNKIESITGNVITVKAKDVKYKENTTLNNKGDNFYHSVFIQSNLFDENFSFKSMLGDDNLASIKTKQSKEFKWLKKECDGYLAKIRRPFIKEYARTFIEKLKSKSSLGEVSKSLQISIICW